ncbi:hypothetical protein P280DRAFT_231247 [Massarina eburnea CBS 473.64]|uniref:RING-type domain-containing protein n=1 Tax=Massarina eburnea CBS 473.64 TaxID=1395130 RepID=A0A6A6SAY7_9PLEO|nr:hypothetical protein P280DRAFT_231247 [Massarina eburnea CBS 473.64]
MSLVKLEQEHVPPGESLTDLEEPYRTHYDCTVCAQALPPAAFPMMQSFSASDTEEPNFPGLCYEHFDLINSPDTAVCTECLGQHFSAQFHALGAANLSCVQPDCKPELWGDDFRWIHFAHNYLPESDKQAFNEELFENVFEKQVWVCPDGCSLDSCWTLPPRDTYGYPYVECPGCKGHFCAVCRVHWHKNLTCQEWQKHHPVPQTLQQQQAALNEGELLSIEDLVLNDARLCPRCQIVIEKVDGCDLVECVVCGLYFHWHMAEKVKLPTDISDSGESHRPKEEAYQRWTEEGWTGEEMCELDRLEEEKEEKERHQPVMSHQEAMNYHQGMTPEEIEQLHDAIDR